MESFHGVLENRLYRQMSGRQWVFIVTIGLLLVLGLAILISSVTFLHASNNGESDRGAGPWKHMLQQSNQERPCLEANHITPAINGSWLGDSCSGDDSCPENSVCESGQCSCNLTYMYFANSGKCHKGSLLGVSCSGVDSCPANSVCESGQCSCNLTYFAHSGKCYKDEIFLRQTTTRIDLIEPSLVIWSGHFPRRSDCTSKCTQEPDCVSLLYNMADESCDLFNVIYDSDARGDIDYYWVLEDRGNRWVPESCLNLSTCSGIRTDGEYWVYPTVTNRRRTKIYCHNLATEPSPFITLKYPNSFIFHDGSNWIKHRRQCQSSIKPPLKTTEFLKVKIDIESMVVNGSDYTFTLLTGSNPIQYGHARDCNGEHFRKPCPHFGTATIDTRGTGLIVDPTVDFGLKHGYKAAMKNFHRSVYGQISFTCAGWCGICGPISGPIKFKHSMDFISASEAQAVICHK
ncbi:uncharacterized protein LOC128161359 isoform X2 [Crassostrea angulata]|uniref:uncharacterized protein LOC128161359 isoform X2 n=1 Tax=Magallana angulata TaxID=2784310 RepID=UPI0022B1C68D|nr:uncharacterized protein LOC128161359 isoform X2 [Crassostrea angulata]